MSGIPRWSIEELVARYTLEPELHDVFVEGEFDKAVLSENFELEGMSDTRVYSIDSVHVPGDQLRESGFTSGNKQRVIMLAMELSHDCKHSRYRCLVDRDIDEFTNSVQPVPNLVWTKFANLEMYFWKDSFLRSLLLKTSKAKISRWDCFVKSVSTALRQSFALRLTDRTLELRTSKIPFEKHIVVNGDVIEFDVEKYIHALLAKNAKLSVKPRFIHEFNERLKTLPVDVRHCGHGHDFVSLLCMSIRGFRGKKHFADSEFVYGAFTLRAHEAKEILTEIGL